jgi:hypothetical protein
VLFAADVRVLFFDAAADAAFEAATAACLVVFVGEMLLRAALETRVAIVDAEAACAAGDAAGRAPASAVAHATWRAACGGRRRHVRVQGYAVSFLFGLDVLAAVSLLPEISWLWGALVAPSGGEAGAAGTGQLSTARASRVSRLGARLGRIIRVVRIVRMFKLYSLWRARGGGGGEGSSRTGAPPSSLPSDDASSSQIGRRLSNAITRTVILLVLLMLLLEPLFIYAPEGFGHEEAAALAHAANEWRGPGWTVPLEEAAAMYATWGKAAGVLAADVGAPKLVRLVVASGSIPGSGDGGGSSFPPPPMLDLPDAYRGLRQGGASLASPELQRFAFTGVLQADGVTPVLTELWFNMRPVARLDAANALGLTLFVVVLLLLGALQFSADAQALVLRPIEGMIAFVERISFDADATGALGGGNKGEGSLISSRDNTGYAETTVLENTIKKIVGVLRVGFGARGIMLVARHLGVAPGAGGGTPSPADAATAAAAAAIGHAGELARVLGARLTTDPGRAKQPLVGTVVTAASPLPRSLPPSAALPAGMRGSGVSAPIFALLRQQQQQQQQHMSPQLQQAHPPAAAAASVAPLFDPFQRGRTQLGVFVAVRIPHCDALVGALGEAVVPYLNKLAKVVHDTTLSWGGCVLANSHAGFELAWLLDDDGGNDSNRVCSDGGDGGGAAKGRAHLGRSGSSVAIHEAAPMSGSPTAEGVGETSRFCYSQEPPTLTAPQQHGRRVSLAALALTGLLLDGDVGDATAHRQLEPAQQPALPASRRRLLSAGWRGPVFMLSSPAAAPLAAATGAADRSGTCSPVGSPTREVGHRAEAVAEVSATSTSAQAGEGGALRARQHRRRSTAFEVLRGSLQQSAPVAAAKARGATDMQPPRRLRSASMGAAVASLLHNAAAAQLGPRLMSAGSKQLETPLLRVAGQPALPDHGSGSARGAAPTVTAAGRLPPVSAALAEAAERALVAALKTIAALRRSYDVQEGPEAAALRVHPLLAGHRLPALHFGIHVGQAVEGALGSVHRVDPLCMGTAVNVAGQLAGLAPAYGAALLMSSTFVRLLPPGSQRLCRPLDSIRLLPPRQDEAALRAAPQQQQQPTGAGFTLFSFDVWDWGATARAAPPSVAAATSAAKACTSAAPAALLPFVALVGPPAAPAGNGASGGGSRRWADEADVYNVSRRPFAVADRHISILGAADIVEHPVQTGRYHCDMFDTDSDLLALRAPVSREPSCARAHWA